MEITRKYYLLGKVLSVINILFIISILLLPLQFFIPIYYIFNSTEWLLWVMPASPFLLTANILFLRKNKLSNKPRFFKSYIVVTALVTLFTVSSFLLQFFLETNNLTN